MLNEYDCDFRDALARKIVMTIIDTDTAILQKSIKI